MPVRGRMWDDDGPVRTGQDSLSFELVVFELRSPQISPHNAGDFRLELLALRCCMALLILVIRIGLSVASTHTKDFTTKPLMRCFMRELLQIELDGRGKGIGFNGSPPGGDT